MIQPTAEFDPMYARDGVPFREKMSAWIRRHFPDVLGPDAYLLETEGGLDALQGLVELRRAERAGALAQPTVR